jgi:subtilisin family serine protease
MTAGEGGRPANINAISASQAGYIQENVPGATLYPPGSQPGGTIPSEFFYRGGHLLARDRDLQDVLSALARLASSPTRDNRRLERAEATSRPIPGLTLVKLTFSKDLDKDPVATAQIMFSALEAIERQLGPGKAAPDHLLSVTATPNVVTWCPATEPVPVPPDVAPQPAISRSGCDGRGTLVAVVDEGLVEDAPVSHPWMLGVTGETDQQVDEGVSIGLYGGHGTFIASIIRAMAPRAEVRVARVFQTAGAAYESDVVSALLSVLDWAPDVISLSAGTHTWNSGGLLSFHAFVDGALRECPGTVLVSAAGNDGADWKFSPAEMESVIGVGALGPPGDALAWFSDYGDWVKVYAPGQDLVQAFARGTYTYQEQNADTQAEFAGMASWSGTSFSTPVVSGLIAARMSGTGESAREAADSLLQLARAQALPGVGPVLRPGQACLRVCERPCRDRLPQVRCDCHS